VDKRTVVAIALIGLIIIILPWYMKQIGGNAPKQTEMEETVSQRETVPGVEAGKLTEASKKEEYPPVETGQVLANIKEVDPREIKVESDLFRGVIDTKGAVLTSWDIKPRLKNPQEQEWVKLLPTIVESGALSLSFPYNGREICTDELVFESNDQPLVLNASRQEGSLMFSAVTAEGLRIVKEFLFHYRKQSFGLRVKIEGAGIFDEGRQYTLWWNPGLRPTEKKHKDDLSEKRHKDDLSSFDAYVMLGDELVKTSFGRKQVIVDSAFSGDTKWMATKTKYFLMAMLPPQDVDGLGVKINWVFQKENKETDSPEQRAIGGGIHMPLQRGMCDHSWEIYLGPMDYFTLQEYGRGLERTVYLGRSVLRWIGLLFLRFFILLYRLVPNYGVVIIVFSIVVKAVFYPLSRKSIASIRKMQEIQPEMKKLQAKHKKDPAKLRTATMELYRKNKVSPVSGCFPMLLQMPVFFALYAVFRNTIELRGASFLWIKDLSAPDTVFYLPASIPFYGNAVNIMPIIMAVTMFIQQKISMKDPQQKIMVYMMPFFLFFIFNNISSGLVLYWTMFNLLQILQERIYTHHQTVDLVSENQESEKERKA